MARNKTSADRSHSSSKPAGAIETETTGESDTNLAEPKGFLGAVVRIGNKIPDITTLFVGALVIVLALSALLSRFTFGYVNPASGEQISIVNMLAPEKLVDLLASAVTNFATFPALGMVIVATIGIGIADGSGFINAALRKLLARTPKFLLTPMIVVAGMLSHLGPDTGYVVIIPVAAYMFYAVGRHPLAGIAASFAGIAGAFAANYTPSAIDPVIQGFTEPAAQIIDPNYSVNILSNYFYGLGATFIVIPALWLVTDKWVEPWCQRSFPIDVHPDEVETVDQPLTAQETRALYISSAVLLIAMVAMAVTMIPADSNWRSESGSLTAPDAPVMKSIVTLIFVATGLVGLLYGALSGKFRSPKDVSEAMETMVTTLVPLIVFYFFAAQFMWAFNQSQIGSLLAVSGAEFLQKLNMPPQLTIIGIILFVGLLNLVITSASAKWAILAPIFVPMLMGVGIAPELTQATFRISDSAVNVVTPMFAFYPLIITYCQKYVKKAGIGTLSSVMMPYSAALLISFTIMLFVFWGLNIPLGIDSAYSYSG